MRALAHLQPLVRPCRDKVGGLVRDQRVAVALLGERHPLVAVLDQLRTAVEQLLVVGGIHLLGVLLWWMDVPVGALAAIGALLGELLLGCRLGTLLMERQRLCVALIAAGGERMPLATIAQERRRLSNARHPADLARTIDRIADAAEHVNKRPLGPPRHLFDPRGVRPVMPQLRELARRLRDENVTLRGLALTAQLISSPASALYGSRPEDLRRELGRVCYHLSR